MAMTLRLTPKDEQALIFLAEAEGVSKHQAALRAIHEMARLKGHEVKVTAAASSAQSRYADLLNRLGT